MSIINPCITAPITIIGLWDMPKAILLISDIDDAIAKLQGIKQSAIICANLGQQRKVSDYFHVNRDNWADWGTNPTYRCTSFVVNGVEYITTPIVQSYPTSQVIAVATQIPPFDTIPAYDASLGGTTNDGNFIDYMNLVAATLSLPNYVFRESPLMKSSNNSPMDYPATFVSSLFPNYGCGFQIARPALDTFLIVVESYDNGTLSHTMHFSESQCLIDGAGIPQIPTIGNIY